MRGVRSRLNYPALGDRAGTPPQTVSGRDRYEFLMELAGCEPAW